MVKLDLCQWQRSNSRLALFLAVWADGTTRRIAVEQLHCSANQNECAGRNNEENSHQLPVHGMLRPRMN